MKRYQRFSAFLLLLALFAAGGRAAAQEPPEAAFSDVSPSDWFYDSVMQCSQTGLILGRGRKFAPYDPLSSAEAITLAVRLHQSFYGLALPASASDYDWFGPYAKYAGLHGLAGADGLFEARNRTADRGEFAGLILKAVPASELPPVNEISVIPDVAAETAEGAGIYRLYRAGILTGTNEYGYFRAGNFISRAEAAAILCRITDPGVRIRFTLTPLPAEPAGLTQLPAVFDGLYITDFDGSTVIAGKQSAYALFDLSGRQLTPFINGDIYRPSCGIYRFAGKNDGGQTRFGYYAASGALLCGTDYDLATDFINGFAAVQNCPDGGCGDIYILNTGGEIVRTIENPAGYRLSWNLTGRYYAVLFENHQSYFLDTETGSFRASPYLAVDAASDGMLRFADPDYRSGYLNEELTVVIAPQYKLAGDFRNGFAVVSGEAYGYGAIDKTGRLALPMAYHYISGFNSAGLTLVGETGAEEKPLCLIDTAGNVVATLRDTPGQGGSGFSYHLEDSYIYAESLFGCKVFDLRGTLLTDGVIGDRIIPSRTSAIVHDYDSDMYYLVKFEA